MEQRLTKAERIQKRPDFLRIQGSGRKFHTPSFICFGMLAQNGSEAVAASNELSESRREQSTARPARLGITVSRRVGGAVTRNRVKRLVREAYRRHKPLFPVGMELVVIARPEASKVAYVDVERELCEVSRRIRQGGARSRSQ